MAEGAHQLTFSYKLCGTDSCIRNLCSVLKKGVDLFSGADGSRYGHLLDTAVGSRTYSNASESHVRENERPQVWIVTEISMPSHKNTLKMGVSSAILTAMPHLLYRSCEYKYYIS